MQAGDTDAQYPDDGGPPENGGEGSGAEEAPVVSDGLTLLQRARRELRVDGDAFRRRLNRLRARQGWSYRDLAKASGVSHAAIRNIELGHSGSPDPETTRALAWALGYRSAADMMGDTEAGRPDDLPERPRKGPAPANVAPLAEQVLAGLVAAYAAAAEPGVPPPAGLPGPIIALAAGAVVFFDPLGGKPPPPAGASGGPPTPPPAVPPGAGGKG